jgi:cell division protein ZapA (FtsZ GTPase activity inhibitor)
MDSNLRQLRPGIVLLVCLVALATITTFFWRTWAQDKAVKEALRQESQQLRAQLEERDQQIKALQGKVRQLRGVPGITPLTGEDERMSGSGGIEIELSHRLADLTVLQSNMLALVERLTARVSALDSTDALPKGGQAVVSVLENYLAQYQQQAEEAKQKAASFLLTLNVPAEIAGMEAKTALENANLKLYWPYFEARTDRENAEVRIDRLRRQVERARINASIEAATSGGK